MKIVASPDGRGPRWQRTPLSGVGSHSPPPRNATMSFRFARSLGIAGLLGLAAGAYGQPQKKAASEADRALLKTFREEFVAITPGEGKFPKSVVMGTPRGPFHEEPAHEVTLAGPFFMAKYELPQNLYESLMGTNP